MSNIQFWLSFDNGAQRIRLPVNPETVSVTNNFGFEEVSVSHLGEYTIIGERGLKDITFSSFFPRDYNPAYCEYANIARPLDLVNRIERWQHSRRPIRLTVTGTLINHEVTIRDFSYDVERGGNVGDIYFTLALKEYRPVSIRYITVENNKAKKSTTSSKSKSSSNKATSYTVKKGDSLSKIAARSDVYGDGSKWRKIYDANKKTIGKNPNEIQVGMKLVLPQ